MLPASSPQESVLGALQGGTPKRVLLLGFDAEHHGAV